MSAVHAVIAWSGFLGAWLLVAGPLFQAAVDAGTEDGTDDAEVGPEELHALVDRVPAGWTEVGYAGRTWGLTRTDHAHGGTTTLYAEELGGTSAVSANVWHTRGGDVLRPCEMLARVVLDFLRGWEHGA